MAYLARPALIAFASLLLAASAALPRPVATSIRLHAADGGTLEIRNAGALPATVRMRVAIESRRAGTWTDTHVEINAIETCFDTDGNLKPMSAREPTVIIQPAQRVAVVRWMGYSCRKQCPSGCGINIRMGPGPFRFVATTVPDGERVHSNAFSMPSRFGH